MRNLNQFNRFDFEAFIKGKVLKTTGLRENCDYATKEHLGTTVDVVITEDNTSYQTKNGNVVSNLYEKMSLKVSKDVNVPIGAQVVPVNPVATIYGDYRNMLSVKCSDIKVISPTTTTTSSQANMPITKTPLRKEL